MSLRYEPPEVNNEDDKKKKKKKKEGRLHVRIQEAQGLFYDDSFVKWLVCLSVCVSMCCVCVRACVCVHVYTHRYKTYSHVIRLANPPHKGYW